MRTGSRQLALGVVLALGTAGTAAGLESKDAYFGEALFHAYQGHYFEALERLDAEIAQHRGVDEPELDSLHPYLDQAEFSVGDFELHYRMHHRAGRAIEAVLHGDVAAPVRNEAAFRLARIHFHKSQPNAALRTLDRIDGPLPAGVRGEAALLRANILMALGRAAEAIDVLRPVQALEELKGFSAYNLGIALLRDERSKEAVRQLDKAGRVKGRDRETLAIRDKANFVLGTMLLEASEFAAAQHSLDRVRLSGPFSNRALLGAGWADASADNFERALVPWSLLATRDATDSSVQEAMLALPYAYGQLEIHGRAATLYERAVATYGDELTKLDASMASIRSGEFLKALVREEIRQDRDWVVRLRSLPDAPETFYLVSLLASHDFQTALQNHLDLEDLRRKLASWRRSLDSLEEMTGLRRAYYEPLLPEIDRRFRSLDAQMRLRLEQRKHVDRRLQQMLTAPRPELLATAGEQGLRAQLDQLEDMLAGSDAPLLRRRIQRIRGVLSWQVETQYHDRLTRAHANLRALDADVTRLTQQYDAYVRTRQAALHSYSGYSNQIDDLRTRVARASQSIHELTERQGDLLESVALRELAARRERLEEYQNQARFAFADSYDRAVKVQPNAKAGER